MTEATLNANNYIDICSIPSKLHTCIYDRMKNIYAQNQSSIQRSCVWKAVHNRTFWITLASLDSQKTPTMDAESAPGGTSLCTLLRFCRTAITLLRSPTAILPLLWRHDIAALYRICREDLRNERWRHAIWDVFTQNMTYVLQNLQFSQYFKTTFTIFFLILTGESDFLFYLLVRQNKLSMSDF